MVQNAVGMFQLLESSELNLTADEKKRLLMEVRAELRSTMTKEEAILLRDLGRAVESNVRRTTLLDAQMPGLLGMIQSGSTRFMRRMRGAFSNSHG